MGRKGAHNFWEFVITAMIYTFLKTTTVLLAIGPIALWTATILNMWLNVKKSTK